MNKALNDIIACVPRSASIDWAALGKTELAPLFEKMKRTEQSPLHHGEGNVYLHTRAVCEKLVSLKEYMLLSEQEQNVMFFAALLHDIGKIVCTRTENGVIISPHHSSVGANMARDFMWRVLGACGEEKMQDFRESVCALILYHSFPPYAIEREDAERHFQRIASLGELAKGFSIRKLCLLEKADVLGRISKDSADWLERVECCLMMAEEFECADAPYIFASDAAKRAYFKGKTNWKQDKIYDAAWGEIVLMAGLPGTGKDTWIRENLPDLPMISLDVWRERLGIAPGENQGEVLNAAREEAREYLRKKQPFVWNATNLLSMHRSSQISLFEDYGASVRTVFLETGWQEGLRRNSERKARVPENVIESMLSKTTLPERHESRFVEWKIV
jgi:putative nucleotidyltransferase with HDIG domain